MKKGLTIVIIGVGVAMAALAQSYVPTSPSDSWLARQILDLQTRMAAVESVASAAIASPSPATPDGALYWIDGALVASPY